MNQQGLLLSVLGTVVLVYQASSQGYNYQQPSQGYNYQPPGQQGYNYPRPDKPFLYPGENETESSRRGRSKVIAGTLEDNKDSDLILERNKTKTTTSGGGRVVEKVTTRKEVSTTPQGVSEETAAQGGTVRKEEEEVTYDEQEAGVTREDALNRGANVENIQDVRERVNNEIVNEEIIEERQRFVEGDGGDNGNGELGIEGGGTGTETESGSSSTFTRRRANLRDADRRKNDRRTSSRTSSTNIREERVQSTARPRGGSSNRDIANKAYGIGLGNDESISGSSTRSRLLEQSFRKDVKAPNYGNVPDDENFNIRSNSDRDVTSSTNIRKSISSASRSSPRSYGSGDDDDDDDIDNVVIRKTSTRTNIDNQGDGDGSSVEGDKGIGGAQLIEGGAFAASNKDQVINRGKSVTTKTSSIKSSSSAGKYYGGPVDDSDGAGSRQFFRVTSFSSGGGGRRVKDRNSRDAVSSTSGHSPDIFRTRRSGETGLLPSHYRQLMLGAPSQIAALTGATFMHRRIAPICPRGGCVLSR